MSGEAGTNRVARPRAQHRPGREATRSRALRFLRLRRHRSHISFCKPAGVVASSVQSSAHGAASCRCATRPPCRDGRATRFTPASQP